MVQKRHRFHILETLWGIIWRTSYYGKNNSNRRSNDSYHKCARMILLSLQSHRNHITSFLEPWKRPKRFSLFFTPTQTSLLVAGQLLCLTYEYVLDTSNFVSNPIYDVHYITCIVLDCRRRRHHHHHRHHHSYIYILYYIILYYNII